MIHLRSITFKPGTEKLDGFPFTVPFVRRTRRSGFRSPVTSTKAFLNDPETSCGDCDVEALL